MKKILLIVLGITCSLAVSAQSINVYENGKLENTYQNSATDSYEVEFIDAVVDDDPNLIPRTFTVNDRGQKVQLAKSNLYWDGSNYRLEENPTDYPTTWDPNHVGHFFWTSLNDYCTGETKYMPYAFKMERNNVSNNDKAWCGVDNPLTADGSEGLYMLDMGDWLHLCNKRDNASNLRKFPVTVKNGDKTNVNCLIIAPDDYDFVNNPLKDEYTLEEINQLNLACLPCAGCRPFGQSPQSYEYKVLIYWADDTANDFTAYLLYCKEGELSSWFYNRNYARPIRLVTNIDNPGFIVYKNGVPVKTYKNTAAKQYKIVAEDQSTQTKSIFIPGKFTVGENKKVQFTSGNLYFDGSKYKFEENQTDYPKKWDENHVGHFYWINTTDLQNGYRPYAEAMEKGEQSSKDTFFLAEGNQLFGGEQLYVLSQGEFNYLLSSRTNAANLYKSSVTVDDNKQCLIIAPDDFKETLKSTYTLEEINSLGLVCLPAAGYRWYYEKVNINNPEMTGQYWLSSTTNIYTKAYFVESSSYGASVYYTDRNHGLAIRLVKNAE